MGKEGFSDEVTLRLDDKEESQAPSKDPGRCLRSSCAACRGDRPQGEEAVEMQVQTELEPGSTLATPCLGAHRAALISCCFKSGCITGHVTKPGRTGFRRTWVSVKYF